LNIINIHTDAWTAYNNVGLTHSHTKTKDHTTQIESLNSDLRHYLPCLIRRTKNYTKSKDMLDNKLYNFSIFHNKNIKKFIDFIKFCCIFVNINIKEVKTDLLWCL
jgi:hypothetical protein